MVRSALPVALTDEGRNRQSDRQALTLQLDIWPTGCSSASGGPPIGFVRLSVGIAVNGPSLRSNLVAALGGRGEPTLFLAHLANNLARCVSFPALVGILPEIVKDVSLPNFDDLSGVQFRDIERIIFEDSSDEVPLPTGDLDPHPLVTAVRCSEWHLDLNELARSETGIEVFLMPRQLRPLLAAFLKQLFIV